MTSPDGFHRKPLNPCEPIQAAQARRMVHQLRMTRAEVIAVGDAGHYSADAYIYAGQRNTPPHDRGSRKRGLTMLPDDQLEDYHRETEEPAPHGAWIAWLILATVAGWLAWAFYAAVASIA